MPAGRPRKPKHVKQAQGTLEKSREIEHYLTYTPLSSAPEPPRDLDENGRNYYRYICKLMISKRLLTPAFLFDVERASFWWQEFKKAQLDISQNGTYEVSKTGWRQISPTVSVVEKATKFLNEFDRNYGLNLVASQKIEMPEDEEEIRY